MIDHTSGVSCLFASGHVLAVNEGDHVHSLDIFAALCQSGKFVDSGMCPSFSDDGVWVVDQVTTGHPSVEFFIKDGSCIEPALNCWAGVWFQHNDVIQNFQTLWDSMLGPMQHLAFPLLSHVPRFPPFIVRH